LLYNEHIKTGRDLERRIAKLREENKDPSLPQKMPTHAEHVSFPLSGGPRSPYLVPSPPPPQNASIRLTDSQNNVDESFMVLGQRVRDALIIHSLFSHPAQSDPGDAFNHFWRIMEGMMDNLSQPVAFTTAPLGTESAFSGKAGLQRDGSLGSETEREEPFVSRFSRKLGLDSRLRPSMLLSSKYLQSYSWNSHRTKCCFRRK
jgi:hypothetical protein